MVEIKSASELREMRALGKISSRIINNLVRFTKPGMSTRDIELKAMGLMDKMNVKSAFLGYKGYPSSLCVSVNDELIHGIPKVSKVLESGDLVTIDLGLYNGAVYSDVASSFSLGKTSKLVRDLLKIGKKALGEAIKIIKPLATIGDIGWAIQKFVEKKGFCVVKKFVGHGIGRSLHEPPEIPNFGEPGQGLKLQEGMVLAIEPMVTVGSQGVEVLSDGWTVVSRDKKPCVHFEHTVAVVKKGHCILTQ